MKTPKYPTPIHFESFSKPTSFNNLIDIVWRAMCENHEYGNYFLGKDQDLETRSRRDIFPPYFKPHSGFDTEQISLNDILIVHRRLFDFMSKVIASEIKEWTVFFRREAGKNEPQRAIINAYHENTGIPKSVLRQRLKRNPILKAKARIR